MLGTCRFNVYVNTVNITVMLVTCRCNLYVISVYITVMLGTLQRDRLTVMLSVLLYSILSVQIVYSVQLNCTKSNYRERDRVTVMLSELLYSILSVQIVYSVQLIYTDSNYRETDLLLCWVRYCTAYRVYR